MLATAKCTRLPVSVDGSSIVKRSFGKGYRQTAGSSGSQGQVQSALHETKAPQVEPAPSHCSPGSMLPLPQRLMVVVVVLVVVVVVVVEVGHTSGAGAFLAMNLPGSSWTIVPPKSAQ